jgi:hypothetical protein
VVTTVAVDESTLPEGVTYSVRDGSVVSRTKDGDDHDMSKDVDDPSEETDDGAAEDEPATVVDVASVEATADDTDEEADTESVESDEETDSATTFFSGRAGVRFAMGERWAGLLILVNGVIGDESVAHIKTILVSPPANGRDDDVTEETKSDESVDDADKPDRHRDASRDRQEDRDGERSDKRDRGRDNRHDDGGDHDRGSGSDSNSRGSSGRGGNR